MFPRFSQQYLALPDRMRAECQPTPVAAPRLLAFNHSLAEALGFDPRDFDAEEATQIFSGTRLPPGVTPVAAAYAGHQFGNFVPQLGDGRALLLGELAHRDGRLRDVQLKGSGRTPFSRGGDGRSPIGPVLREYLVSEAMHALGVPTTRALAAVATGESVHRQLPEPGAVLTRVAASHLRVGTFQFFAARGDIDAVKLLVTLSIERHYPELVGLPEDEQAMALLDAVIGRQASLVAQWKGLGFIHGVMNTDNCAISGETIDYGPCAFMDEYHPATVFSSIDERGRYAWVNQPVIAQWNLARFAETLLALIDDDQQRAIDRATAAIESFSERHEQAWADVLRGKLGLTREAEPEAGGDLALGGQWLEVLQTDKADFTLSFRELAAAIEPGEGEQTLRQRLNADAALDAWLPSWRERLSEEGRASEALQARLQSSNPLVIPRNHLVEGVIRAAVDHDDLAPFETLLAAVANPWSAPADQSLLRPPEPGERVLRTFCGT
ncbi:UPF0061 protein [Halomonas cupida]|uniref:Protein nucleotidyltransferase YdiU n=1 Tax=Halomonas cupida TaxID=44933 RepID=A0A1M7HHQ8_9GAMM|nr:YdiU family protein [Halomonas cupida]GEN25466.1 UPF0061 protein [Halomonas cupida]SHM27677.1 Uncharacterized conserved protein YdiU, UPF0061 family [Halomonas cupida]